MRVTGDAVLKSKDQRSRSLWTTIWRLSLPWSDRLTSDEKQNHLRMIWWTVTAELRRFGYNSMWTFAWFSELGLGLEIGVSMSALEQLTDFLASYWHWTEWSRTTDEDVLV